jgi:hypothetical protein
MLYHRFASALTCKALGVEAVLIREGGCPVSSESEGMKQNINNETNNQSTI